MAKAVHVVPGLDDPTCGIAVAAKQLMARGVGEDGEVWVHSMWTPLVVAASFKALLSGRRLVRMPHGCTDPTKLGFHWSKKRWVAPVERWLFRHAEKIVATCEEEAEWIRSFEPRARKVEIVRLSEPVAAAPQAAAAPQREPGAPLRLLYVGRLHPLKGVEFLLRAMPSAGCSLVVIGKDEGEGERLKTVASSRGLDVEFRGVVPEREKEAAYRRCDALVLPTLSENFGLVVAEALERGARVVTTDGAPAWDPDPAARQAEGIAAGCGGRLLYLRGFRDGTPEARIRLLGDAIAQTARNYGIILDR